MGNFVFFPAPTKTVGAKRYLYAAAISNEGDKNIWFFFLSTPIEERRRWLVSSNINELIAWVHGDYKLRLYCFIHSSMMNLSYEQIRNGTTFDWNMRKNNSIYVFVLLFIYIALINWQRFERIGKCSLAIFHTFILAHIIQYICIPRPTRGNKESYAYQIRVVQNETSGVHRKAIKCVLFVWAVMPFFATVAAATTSCLQMYSYYHFWISLVPLFVSIVCIYFCICLFPFFFFFAWERERVVIVTIAPTTDIHIALSFILFYTCTIRDPHARRAHCARYRIIFLFVSCCSSCTVCDTSVFDFFLSPHNIMNINWLLVCTHF